jgi:hypothetical protein
MTRAHTYPFAGRVGHLIGQYASMRGDVESRFVAQLRDSGEGVDWQRLEQALSMVALSRVFRPIVKDAATCVRCSGPVRFMYAHLVGQAECMCLTCAEKQRLEREGRRSDEDTNAWFSRRVTLTGIPDATLDALGITPSSPEPPFAVAKDGRWKGASVAVTRYMRAPRQRTLVLAGDSGVGKSCAAAWACWRTMGLYLSRASWTKLPARAQDDARLRWVMQHAGVVVLDNALDVKPGGGAADSDWESEVVFQVTQERHDNGRATILTTQSSADEVTRAYGTHGEAIVRRARDGEDLAGAPDAGGWARCVWVRREAATSGGAR